MKNKNRVCLSCETPIGGHFNRKRCEPCAAKVRQKPVSTLSKTQIRLAKRYATLMPQKELAAKLGCSRSNLIRWASAANVSLDSNSYKMDMIAKVCAAYEAFGKNKTQKMYPEVRVRSIVERYKFFEPRKTKWTGEQVIELVKMAGLISPSAQWRYFNKPNSFEGGIKSVWIKKLGLRQTSIHGMPHWTAKHLVTVKARYINPFGISRSGETVKFRRVILWSEMEKCLKPEVPEFIRDAVRSLAEFQRKLFGVDDPKKAVLKMIKEREL